MSEPIFVTRASMPPYEEYAEAIRSLWDSHWITNMGMYHTKLEKCLSKYLLAHRLSLMVNGHMALEMAIQAMGFPEGGEVITTPFTFISTTHAIVRNRLKPIFCDIKPEDGTIDENKIEDLITEKTVAIVPVHVYGNICNVDKISELALKYDLKVIYDAAHAFGVQYRGKGIADFGDASCFSFHATKVFNTIEGGAVTFQDSKMYEKLYNLKNFGIRGQEIIVEIGANAKMNEFCAIMGLLNLKHIETYIQMRKKVSEWYQKYLSEIRGIKYPLFNKKDIKYNYAYFPVFFESRYRRDTVFKKLQEKEIYPRKYFYPLTSDAACFKNKYRYLKLPVAHRLSDTVLVLPLYPELTIEDVRRITEEIAKYNI